jgi:hypothetical protein
MNKLVNKVLNNSIEGFVCYEYKEYDWIKGFEVDKVIERGKIIARRPVSLRSRESQPFFDS